MKLSYTTCSEDKTIPIYSGTNVLGNLKNHLSNTDFDKLVIITDSNVNDLWGEALLDELGGIEKEMFVIQPGELAKSLNQYQSLCNEILNKEITKKTVIIAFGGGVVGNIAGFVAGTLFRGIKFVHIPTTIMAQADSTTGGKQAINTAHGKNTIGMFYEPEFILIDFNFLKTLPEREVRSGIAECIKHALCQDKRLLDELEKGMEGISFQDTIQKTIYLKLKTIKKDRKEINEGKILVYGHTIGHAIEILSHGTLNHGEAVSIGMCCAATLSNGLGILSSENKEKHYRVLRKWNLPTKIPQNIKVEEIIDRLHYDKKIKDSDIEMIVLRDIEKVYKVRGRVGLSIDEETLKKSLELCYK